MRLNERRVDLALARTAAVFDAAAAELGEIADGGDPERWSAALGRLAREALDLTGPGATVRVRFRDAALISTVVEAAGGRLEPAEDAPDGVTAVSADGRIEVDATIPVRLERARSRLAEVVAGSIGFDS
jgi:vacuolar-type H+-ATPase subunit E/Vma4